MSDPSTSPTWADVLALVTKLDASGLEDAEVVMDGVSVRVSRSALPDDGGRVRSRSPQPATLRDSTPESSDPPAATTAAPEGAAVPDGPVVTAPMLGVVYVRPSPDAAPFVTVGDTVTPETTVAIVEVMKMMNQVVAGVHGTIVEICAHDGQLVEHGDVLVRLEVGR